MNSLTRIGLMLGGAYFLHSALNKSQAAPISVPPAYEPTTPVPSAPLPTSTQPISTTGYPVGTFPMARGSRSTFVAKLQSRLGFVGKDLDGVFGPMTEAALKKQFGMTRIANSVDYERIMAVPKPLPTTPVQATPTPAKSGESVKVGELNIVFNALFKKSLLIPFTYEYVVFVDQNAILNLLESRTDAFLVTYAAYWKAYWKEYKFAGAAKATRFLRSDIEKSNSDLLKSVRMKNFIARLKRLNIA